MFYYSGEITCTNERNLLWGLNVAVLLSEFPKIYFAKVEMFSLTVYLKVFKVLLIVIKNVETQSYSTTRNKYTPYFSKGQAESQLGLHIFKFEM